MSIESYSILYVVFGITFQQTICGIPSGNGTWLAGRSTIEFNDFPSYEPLWLVQQGVFSRPPRV